MLLNKNKKMIRHNKRISPLAAVLIILAIVVLAIGGYAVYRLLSSNQDGSSETTALDTPEQDSEQTQKMNNNQKKDFIENTQLPPQQDQPSAPTDKSSEISMQAEQQGDTIVVTTRLPGFSDGVCTLTATNSSKQHEVSADIMYQPSYSSCMGFSIPKQTLGSGAWRLSLKATSVRATASSTATIEVK